MKSTCSGLFVLQPLKCHSVGVHVVTLFDQVKEVYNVLLYRWYGVTVKIVTRSLVVRIDTDPVCFTVGVIGCIVHVVGADQQAEGFVLLNHLLQVAISHQLPLVEHPFVVLTLPFCHDLIHITAMHPFQPSLFDPVGVSGLFHVLKVALLLIHGWTGVDVPLKDSSVLTLILDVYTEAMYTGSFWFLRMDRFMVCWLGRACWARWYRG